MKLRTYITALVGVCLIAATGTPSFISTHEPISFVLDKAAQHDVILLGTTHQQPRILGFISTLLPCLHMSGITHIGLEIASDQQNRLDRFVETGAGLSEIRIFKGIDCAEYRQLIGLIRKNRLAPVALDLPKSMWRGALTRDQWMAKRVSETLQENAAAKMLVVVGNLHTLKTVHWIVPTIKDQFIRYHLGRIHPNLSLYSIAESIDESAENCDFKKWFGRDSGPVGVETLVFDGKLGLTRTVAVKPMTAHDAVDAVIIF